MLYSAVLAGGLSSRMGRDKALLKHQGQTLLEGALLLLQASGCDRVLISGAVPGYDCIADRRGRRGPPGALYSLVKHIQEHGGLNGDMLLLIPVDMPYLEAGVCRRLIEKGSGAQAAHFDTQVFPCLFRLEQSLLDCLEADLLEQEAHGARFSMKGILAARKALQLDAGGIDTAVFDNINKPEDWQRYCSSRAGVKLR